jgi:hypothetical protein
LDNYNIDVNISVESYIVFQGDLSIFRKPSKRGWLKSNFSKIELEKEIIKCFHNNISNPDFIFEIKRSLVKTFTNVSFNFSEEFEDKIKIHNTEEEDFINFSNQALKIWSNDFSSADFNQFCSFLKQNFPRKLYHRQLLSAYHLAFSQNASNFSVPGAGKTSIVYAAFSYLNNFNCSHSKYVNKILVIGPHASFSPWEEQYEECFKKKVKSYKLNGENPKEERIDFLKNNLINDTELILITYESVPILYDYLIPFLQYSNNKVMIVCDEAHKIKSLDGTRANCVLGLSEHASSRVVLTGTPCPNGPEDLYNLFKFLYPKRNVLKFRPSAISSFNQPANFNKLKQLIQNIKPFFLRITKKDLNLPKVTIDSVIHVSLSKLEQDIYNQILKVMEASTSDINRISLHYRLIQSSLNIHLLKNSISINEFSNDANESYFNLVKVLGPDLHYQIKNLNDSFIPAKHLAVLNKTLDLKKKKQKVVIWGVYIDSIKRLHNLLKSKGLVGEIVIGETKKGDDEEKDFKNDNTRKKIINSFKSFGENSLDYIITNPVVLGESVSLHRHCHNSIYFELSYSAAPYVQSRDRIHRVWIENGKQKIYETNYFHFVTKSENIRNIDERIFSRVEKKWKDMEKIIEHEIPLFSENIDKEINTLIKELINDYQQG